MSQKILIISTCENKFHELEFVRPVTDIVKKNHEYEVKHYSEIDENSIESFDKIIICGTALKDFSYKDNLDKFEWIKECDKDLLGICSGSQIICSVFESELKDSKEIGLIGDIKINSDDKIIESENLNEVYALHNKYNEVPDGFEVIAENKIPQIMKKDNIYTILFHPEIRNKKIIQNFLN